MSKLSEFLFRRWAIKLLALLFATSLWLVSTGRDFTVTEVQVIMKLEAPQDGTILMVDGKPGLKEARFNVTLYGPRLNIERLKGQPIHTKHSFSDINVHDIPSGQVSKVPLKFDRSSIANVLPRHVEIRDVGPETIDVRIDRLKTRQMRVNSSVVFTGEDGVTRPVAEDGDGCRDGFRIVRYYPSLRTVTVLGPQSVLDDDRYGEVKAQAARVDNLSESIYRRVSIVPHIEHELYGSVPIECTEEIDVIIEVDEFHTQRELADVQVHLLRPLRLLYVVDILEIDGVKPVDPKRPTVNLTIRGPAMQIAQISANDPNVRVFLDVSDVTRPAEYEKQLTVILPEGVTAARPIVKYDVKPTITTD